MVYCHDRPVAEPAVGRARRQEARPGLFTGVGVPVAQDSAESGLIPGRVVVPDRDDRSVTERVQVFPDGVGVVHPVLRIPGGRGRMNHQHPGATRAGQVGDCPQILEGGVIQDAVAAQRGPAEQGRPGCRGERDHPECSYGRR